MIGTRSSGQNVEQKSSVPEYGQQDFDQNQHDDCDFQHLGAVARGLVGNHLVNSLQNADRTADVLPRDPGWT